MYARWLRNQAVCDCGWQGTRRWFYGAAVADAYVHAAESLCPESADNPAPHNSRYRRYAAADDQRVHRFRDVS